MKFDDIIDSNNADNRPNFNVEDDLQCFMKDDTMFYRKEYYPTMTKCQDCYNKGDANKGFSFILPMIDKGVNRYIKTFDLPYEANELCTPDERKTLAQKIYDSEVESFKEGEY